MTVLVYGRGCAWGMIRGGYTPRDGASRWGAVRPSRISEPFERRTWASQIFCTSLGPYICAPQVAGAVAVGSSGRSSRSEHRRGTAGQSAARPVLRRDRCWNAEPGRVYAPANKIRRDLISCNGLRRWFRTCVQAPVQVHVQVHVHVHARTRHKGP